MRNKPHDTMERSVSDSGMEARVCLERKCVRDLLMDFIGYHKELRSCSSPMCRYGMFLSLAYVQLYDLHSFFFFFCLFRTAPMAYRGSQARG